LNFIYAFKCYQQNVSGFTLAGPPCNNNQIYIAPFISHVTTSAAF